LYDRFYEPTKDYAKSPIYQLLKISSLEFGKKEKKKGSTEIWKKEKKKVQLKFGKKKVTSV
jgi:hypothetical protein